jgi:hypothetical protein
MNDERIRPSLNPKHKTKEPKHKPKNVKVTKIKRARLKYNKRILIQNKKNLNKKIIKQGLWNKIILRTNVEYIKSDGVIPLFISFWGPN